MAWEAFTAAMASPDEANVPTLSCFLSILTNLAAKQGKGRRHVSGRVVTSEVR